MRCLTQRSMAGKASITATALAAVLLGAPLVAQRPPPDEFLHLESVLRAAMEHVAPSLVTVETFGGTRKVLAGGGPGGPSDAPGNPRKSGKKAPKKGKKNNTKKKKKKKKKKKGIGAIRQPGFLQAQGATSGVVLTSDGWILVSRFALNFDPTTILVTLPDGRSFHATRAGEDTSRGLALVKIDVTGLPVPEFVHPEAVRVGQWAFVLGRTFGREEPSVHMGIVSATGRLFGRALQTDAYTSPANYGGALIDIEGRVLGISVPLSRAGRDAGAELYDSGIGFGASIAGIEPLLERMKRDEILHRGWLGVSTTTDFLGPGAKLSMVAANSAAADAGLKKDDIIAVVDDIAVRNSFHLQTLISSKMGGDTAHLKIVRATGDAAGVAVVLQDLPEAQRKPKKPAEEAAELPWEQGDKKSGQ